MYNRIIHNDIRNNKAVTIITILFIMVAALLISLTAILVVNLGGAIDTLMKQAKTPHFMQMHAGELNRAKIINFAENNEQVQEYQIVEFLNMDGAQIIFENGSLAGSVQDNGFTVQNQKFDYLLDLDGKNISVTDGEIYVPVNYMRDGSTKINEKIVLQGKEFIVKGFLRDSQMNSLLSSSKRFLVSQNDFEKIRQFGMIEYLIEFRLNDLSKLGEFEAAYINAELDSNGPTITYPHFRIINAISDGIMMAVIILVCALIIGIAFMCIRFTLLTKIEDDYREIGVLKAIGLRVSDIKRIYLAKYTALAAAGSLAGFALSFVFQDLLLENIRLFMGKSENASFAPILSGFVVILLFLTVVFYVNSVLKQFQKITPTEAIRFGVSQEKSNPQKQLRLSHNSLLGTNIFLGIKDVLSRKSLYATMLAVLVISAFIIIVPQNLFTTISSNSFTGYMGIGHSDLRIDIQQTDHIPQKVGEIVTSMKMDRDIENFVVLTTKSFLVKRDDGQNEHIKVELGDHSIFPINYSEGKAPIAENEIALSIINARELNKRINDEITLIINGQEKAFTVCGIYSDITNGGKTAKADFADESTEIMWSVISIRLTDRADIEKKAAEYTDKYPYAKAFEIDEYIRQTFGSTIDSVRKASFASIAIALFTTSLVTLLFMRMLVIKDKFSIAVMKAFGFTNSDIKWQFVARSTLILLAGIVLGTLLANTLGELLMGAVISSFGASSFKFVINPLEAYVLSPLLMIISTLMFTFMGTTDAGKIRISDNIKE